MKSFYVRSKTVDDIAVIYPKGHLDAHNVERFEKEILKQMGNNIFNLIINCKELNYISSAGMGIIMGYLDEIREKGGDIKLCSLDEKVYEIFDLVGFTEIYDFMDNEDASVEKYKNVS